MHLGSFLHDKPPNIENEKFYHLGHVVRWMRCAAEGLRYLHNASPEPIIHRDIKPDNCLLFDDGLRNVVLFKHFKSLSVCKNLFILDRCNLEYMYLVYRIS